MRNTSSRRIGRESGRAAASLAATLRTSCGLATDSAMSVWWPAGYSKKARKSASLISTRSAETSSDACGRTPATVNANSLPE